VEAETMIRVTKEDFSVDEELRRLKAPSVGAIVTFIGVVRADSEEQRVDSMEIEIYPEMAEKQLQIIRGEAIKKFGVEEILIVHRYGNLVIGSNIVLIAVASGHRNSAFDACRYVIDELKKRVPIWKKEHTPVGASWVEVGRPDKD
jgi:molybdopterin synthase catalytic subunit